MAAERTAARRLPTVVVAEAEAGLLHTAVGVTVEAGERHLTAAVADRPAVSAEAEAMPQPRATAPEAAAPMEAAVTRPNVKLLAEDTPPVFRRRILLFLSFASFAVNVVSNAF